MTEAAARGAVAIVQARMGSTRLPGKVLLPLAGRPVLLHVVERAAAAPGIQRVAVATTGLPRDEPIRSLCRTEDIPCFAGSELDVLDRYYGAACALRADPIVRLTSDCPALDPALVGELVALHAAEALDHAALATGAGAVFLTEGRFPVGVDAECVSFSALAQAWREASRSADREHVTPFLWGRPERFRTAKLFATGRRQRPDLRLTLDHGDDYALLSAIFDALGDRGIFCLDEVLDLLDARPELAELNRAHLESAETAYRSVWPGEASAATVSGTAASDATATSAS
ncbi:MAG TPA: glycosyltransferase family protein [Gaiellaceae bacterium]|nr:glycosyltransferase family protein [Gaiellaceae bacterium]